MKSFFNNSTQFTDQTITLYRGFSNLLPLRIENGSSKEKNNTGKRFILAPNESRFLFSDLVKYFISIEL